VALVLNRKQSVWLGVGLLLTFFGVSALVISGKGSGGIPTSKIGLSKESVEGAATPVAEGTPSQGGGIVLNDFQRSLVKDGKVVWEITGKRGRYLPGSAGAQIDEPRLAVSSAEGAPLAISAGRAELTLSGTELVSADLFDNVMLSKGDTTVKTSKATFVHKDNKVTVPVGVEIENDVVKISGDRLTADLTTQEFTVEGAVHSVVKPRTK
jgi:LPS export ABC transporter protein LptC